MLSLISFSNTSLSFKSSESNQAALKQDNVENLGEWEATHQQLYSFSDNYHVDCWALTYDEKKRIYKQNNPTSPRLSSKLFRDKSKTIAGGIILYS